MSLRKHSSSARGFTLIELLTVIAIIAILMGLLFPAIIGAKDSARNAKAETDIKGIVAAVGQYKLDYGTLPDVAAPGSTTGGVVADAQVGDPKASIPNPTNASLFNILRAIPAAPTNEDDIQNRRRTVFLDGRQVSNVSMPKDGFLDAATASPTQLNCFFDPWGVQYNVVLDASGDRLLDVAKQYTDFGTPNAPRGDVGAFSLGKDKLPGKNGNAMYKSAGVKCDDLVSWQ